MKKILAYTLSLAVILSFTLFTGCGTASKTPDEILTEMAAEFDTMTANLKDETDKTIAALGDSHEDNLAAVNVLYEDINKETKKLYTNTYNNTYLYLEAVLKTVDTSTKEGKEAYYDAVEAWYDEIDDDYWDYDIEIDNFVFDSYLEVHDILFDDYWDEKISADKYKKLDKAILDAEEEESKKIQDIWDDAQDAFSDDYDDMTDAYDNDEYDFSKILKERDLSTTVAIVSTVEEKEEASDDSKKAKGNKDTKKAEKPALTEDMVAGTWKLSKIKYNGSDYTIKEMEALGEDVDKFKDMCFVVKEGGSVYVYSEGEGKAGEWMISAGKLKIGSMDCKYENGSLVYELDSDVALYFEKTSDSQDITEIQKKK